MGIPERALARGSKAGCITDRRRESMIEIGRAALSLPSKHTVRTIEVYQATLAVEVQKLEH